MAKRALLVAALGLVAALLSPAAAGACMLAFRTAQERVRSADIAVYGVIRSVRIIDDDVNGGPGIAFDATVRVNRIYKGTAGRTVRIRSRPSNTIVCAMSLPERGERLGLLMYGPGRPYKVTSGSRMSLGDLGQATGGRFRKPA